MPDKNRQVIVCKMPEGKVAIVCPAVGVPVEACIKDVPKEALSYRVACESCIPKDRSLREYWTDDLEGDNVDVDLSKVPSE